MNRIYIEKTKKGYPAIWEEGGGYTNTGGARIVCAPDGSKKRPVYIRRRGPLACESHALFIVEKGDVVIDADHHRGDFRVTIYKITGFGEDEWKRKFAIIETIDKFDMGEWDSNGHEKFTDAVNAACDKAECYHCREPHYTLIDD